MTTHTQSVAVTGASGYLGSRICSTLESQGYRVTRLLRHPRQNSNSEVCYDLSQPIGASVSQTLRSVDILIHAAYDLSLTSAANIWRVNVEGTRRLLQAAAEAGVSRIIVISSMSAFEGTSQLYGRAKLDIEAMTKEFAGCAIRPGVVYGAGSEGMAGALRKLTKFQIIPVAAGGSGVYTVQENDLMATISALVSEPSLEPGAISAAHSTRVTLQDMMKMFAAEEGRRCHFVPVPWQVVYWLLKAGESLHLRLPFRADSVLGFIYTATSLSGADQLERLGIILQAFPSEIATGI